MDELIWTHEPSGTTITRNRWGAFFVQPGPGLESLDALQRLAFSGAFVNPANAAEAVMASWDKVERQRAAQLQEAEHAADV